MPAVSREVRWSGRVLSADGLLLDPAYFDALHQMEKPSSGAHLQQLLCALQWMRTAIQSFSMLVAPLQGLLEKVYKLAGKSTK